MTCDHFGRDRDRDHFGREGFYRLATQRKYLRKFNLSLLATPFDQGLKVMLQEPIFSGEGVTRTNTNKIRATMLQVFESLSKTCNMLPQQNVALKIALCTLLHEATFNATMLR